LYGGTRRNAALIPLVLAANGDTTENLPTRREEGSHMLGLHTYLTFDGNCAEAMRFYENTLGGKLEMMTFGQSPMASQAPPGTADRIMHSKLSVGDTVLMASDAMAGQNYSGMHGFALSLSYDSVEEGRRIFSSLSDGGRITMPFDKTFWAEGFGMVVDRFGTPWMVNVESKNEHA
jgi:PhnB protein